MTERVEMHDKENGGRADDEDDEDDGDDAMPIQRELKSHPVSAAAARSAYASKVASEAAKIEEEEEEAAEAAAHEVEAVPRSSLYDSGRGASELVKYLLSTDAPPSLSGIVTACSPSVIQNWYSLSRVGTA